MLNKGSKPDYRPVMNLLTPTEELYVLTLLKKACVEYCLEKLLAPSVHIRALALDMQPNSIENGLQT